VRCEWGAYHDGVGEVAIGLALQAHGAELRGHVAIGGGLVQGGLPDAGHLGGHEEGEDTLYGGGIVICIAPLKTTRTMCSNMNKKRTLDRSDLQPVAIGDMHQKFLF